MAALTNLLDLDPAGLVSWCGDLGEKPFRAKQLQRWIHQFGESDFDAMTDLAKSLRDKLKLHAKIAAPTIISDHISADGTRKWLLDVGNGNAVETVFIPEENRGTLCVSTQAGCAVNCRFCSTGKQGFSRNLDIGEIIGRSERSSVSYFQSPTAPNKIASASCASFSVPSGRGWPCAS